MKTLRLATLSLACLATGASILIACGGSTFVDITEYDQSCAADEDCVVVQDGDICCGCPNVAVNRSELERYEDSLASCSAQCDIACAGDLVGACVEGTCDTRSTALICVPGTEEFCACAGGGQGTRACSADGLAYEDCVCA